MTNWSGASANDVVTAEQRAKPMRLMNHLAGANAGKQIFVSAGEPDHLVRKHRAANQDLVVIEKQPINLYADEF